MTKSILVIVTIGSNPSTVVVVVSKTGRNLCAPVLIIASFTVSVLFFKKSNVSINIILLFTTIPARAMTPTPVMTIPNACPVIIKPINTPAVDITTAKRINNPL